MSSFRNLLKNSKEIQIFTPKTEKILAFLEIIVGLTKCTLTAPKLALLGSQTNVFGIHDIYISSNNIHVLSIWELRIELSERIYLHNQCFI